MKPALAIHGLIRRALIVQDAGAEAAADAGAAGADDRRVLAARRAMAAEIIAQEANAIRLKALLDAARDQAANRDIRSAEQRFAAARDEWEAVRQGILPDPDPYADAVGAEEPAVPDAVQEADAIARRNWLLLGGLPLLVLVALGGIVVGALYLPPPGDAAQVAAPHPQARAEPATPVAAQAPEPSVDPKAPPPAEPNSPVKAAAAAKPKLILVPPPPPSRPDRENMATGAPAILDRSGILRRVE